MLSERVRHRGHPVGFHLHIASRLTVDVVGRRWFPRGQLLGGCRCRGHQSPALSPEKELKGTWAHFQAFSRSVITSAVNSGHLGQGVPRCHLVTTGPSQTAARHRASQSFQAASSPLQITGSHASLLAFPFPGPAGTAPLQQPPPSPSGSGDEHQDTSLACL